MQFVWGIYVENIVSLITRMISMEIVWRQCEEWYFLWIFYGRISLEIAMCFHGENMINEIATQFPY